MKKFLIMCFAVIFLAGCGQKESEKQVGIESKKDYIAEAMKSLQEANLPKAIQSFDMAIKQNPQDPNNYLLLGQVYLRLNNFASASDSFEAATRVSPDNGEAYFLLATSRQLQGNHQGAIEAAQASVDSFLKARDEERFKQATGLLRSLVEANAAPQPEIMNPEPIAEEDIKS